MSGKEKDDINDIRLMLQTHMQVSAEKSEEIKEAIAGLAVQNEYTHAAIMKVTAQIEKNEIRITTVESVAKTVTDQGVEHKGALNIILPNK